MIAVAEDSRQNFSKFYGALLKSGQAVAIASHIAQSFLLLMLLHIMLMVKDIYHVVSYLLAYTLS